MRQRLRITEKMYKSQGREDISEKCDGKGAVMCCGEIGETATGNSSDLAAL